MSDKEIKDVFMQENVFNNKAFERLSPELQEAMANQISSNYLTTSNTKEMEPGVELNCLVSEKIFGLMKVNPGFEGSNFEPVFSDGFRVGSYSTDSEYASLVIKKLEYDFEIKTWSRPNGPYECQMIDPSTRNWFSSRSLNSLAHAICLTALKAIGN